MTMTNVLNEVSTPEGFERRVVYKRGTVTAARGLLILGGVGLAWNLITTLLAVQNTSFKFFPRLFFSVHSARMDFDPIVALYTWGPFIAIPLGLILFVYASATARRAKHDLFERFISRGHVAEQQELWLALQFPKEKTTASLTALSNPELGPEGYTQAVESLRATIAAVPVDQIKALTKKLTASTVRASGIEANAIWPDAPHGVILSTKRPGDFLVVIRPDPAKAGSKRELLELSN